MVDYKSGKTRYTPDNLGSLYLDESKLSDNERPVIYIGGQMEHRIHRLENITSKCSDPNHNSFTGSWVFEYPLNSKNNKSINGIAFSRNFLKTLEMAKLGEVDIVTQSYGGTIGALASKSPLIHKVYAVHPPILGTPLAYPQELNHYLKGVFTPSEKAIIKIMCLMVDPSYGFQTDNYYGLDIHDIDLNKLLVIGSSINPDNEGFIVRNLYSIIKKVTGLNNDGVVTYDVDTFNRLGINYMTEEEPINHYQSRTKEHIEKVYSLVRNK